MFEPGSPAWRPPEMQIYTDLPPSTCLQSSHAACSFFNTLPIMKEMVMRKHEFILRNARPEYSVPAYACVRVQFQTDHVTCDSRPL